MSQKFFKQVDKIKIEKNLSRMLLETFGTKAQNYLDDMSQFIGNKSIPSKGMVCVPFLKLGENTISNTCFEKGEVWEPAAGDDGECAIDCMVHLMPQLTR